MCLQRSIVSGCLGRLMKTQNSRRKSHGQLHRRPCLCFDVTLELETFASRNTSHAPRRGCGSAVFALVGKYEADLGTRIAISH